jgi:hypothetical protein
MSGLARTMPAALASDQCGGVAFGRRDRRNGIGGTFVRDTCSATDSHSCRTDGPCARTRPAPFAEKADALGCRRVLSGLRGRIHFGRSGGHGGAPCSPACGLYAGSTSHSRHPRGPACGPRTAARDSDRRRNGPCQGDGPRHRRHERLATAAPGGMALHRFGRAADRPQPDAALLPARSRGRAARRDGGDPLARVSRAFRAVLAALPRAGDR